MKDSGERTQSGEFMLDMPEEQRSCKRVRVSMKLAYKNNDNLYKMGTVSNISRSGMYVDTLGKPDVDGYVIASLDVEEFGKIVWVQGRVVRKTSTGMAVAFTRTDDKGLKNLLSYWCVPF
jgi:hypothetical protein